MTYINAKNLVPAPKHRGTAALTEGVYLAPLIDGYGKYRTIFCFGPDIKKLCPHIADGRAQVFFDAQERKALFVFLPPDADSGSSFKVGKRGRYASITIPWGPGIPSSRYSVVCEWIEAPGSYPSIEVQVPLSNSVSWQRNLRQEAAGKEQAQEDQLAGLRMMMTEQKLVQRD